MNNSNSSTTSIVIADIFWNILFFPIWWYSIGLVEFLKKIKVFLSDKQKSLGLFVWIKNIFVPMYGQKDFQGVMISIVMRFIQIVFRFLAMVFWCLVSFVAVLAWLSFPILSVWGIFYQIF